MWDVHFDYIPPEPWRSMFDPGYTGKLDGRGIAGKRGFPPNASPRDVAHLLALYDGEVRYTDETIGEMLAMLARAGVLDETLVVITADHGEEFKDHGGRKHHRTVHRESVHVPLIFWSATGLPRGVRVKTFVSLADVAPTILDIVGLPPLEGIDGRSLVAAMRGGTLAEEPVLSAMFLPGEEWRRTLSIRRGEDSLILWKKRDRWLAYDVDRDPREQLPRPLRKAERAALERYDAEVLELLAKRRPATGAEQPSSDAAVDPGRAMPPEVAARLRALGYIR
jgi:arylsulfatase A-like enzyme